MLVLMPLYHTRANQTEFTVIYRDTAKNMYPNRAQMFPRSRIHLLKTHGFRPFFVESLFSVLAGTRGIVFTITHCLTMRL